MISLTQLEYIVAVDRHRHFKSAAKACFVTQPTLSMQIQKLESDLEVLIFDRTNQPVTVTAIGRKIIDQAKVILSQVALLNETVSITKREIEGEVRIAVIPTLAPYILPLFLRKFLLSYPKVHLHVEESKTDDLIEDLQHDRIDIGIAATPLHEPSLVEYPIFREPFRIYASLDSKLSHLKKIREDQLETENLLLLTEGHCLRDQALSICQQHSSQKKPGQSQLQLESGSIETLCHLVEAGNGYTFVPLLASVGLDLRKGVLINFQEPQPSREVSLLVHESFIKQSLLNALISCIKSTLPRELATFTQLRTIPVKRAH